MYSFSKLYTSIKNSKWKLTLIVIIILILSLLLRIHFISFQSKDYHVYLSVWYDFIKSHGGLKALQYNFSNYSTPYLYILALSTYLPIDKLIDIKLISIIFDYVLGFSVYLVVKQKYKSGIIPLVFGLITLFVPTVLMNGSIWGQCDSIYTSFLVFSILCLLKKKYAWMCIFFGIAFTFKLQAVFFLPLFVILVLRKDLRIRDLFLIPIPYILSLIPSLLLGRNLFSLLSTYVNQTTLDIYLTLNAPNIYQWVPIRFFKYFDKTGIIFALVIVLIFCLLVYRQKIRIQNEEWVKYALIIFLLVPFLLPQMHERYFFPADILSIIFAAYFPNRFYIPILIQLTNILTYSVTLFSIIIIPFHFIPFPILFALAILIYDARLPMIDRIYIRIKNILSSYYAQFIKRKIQPLKEV